jgi:signal transduction histidine kinase
MLAYGLVDALEGLVDGAQERGLKGCTVTFDVTGEAHSGEHVEIHLYRLAQQALDNALQHSKASEIRLSGTLGEKEVNLEIRDNGVGFAIGEHLDISSLLVNKHFGIAGMFERAALIGAEISIRSQLGQGCCFTIHWAAKDKQTSLQAEQSFNLNIGDGI